MSGRERRFPCLSCPVTLGFPADRGPSRKPDDLYVRRQTARMRLSKYAAYNTYHHCEHCHQYMGFHPRYQVGRGHAVSPWLMPLLPCLWFHSGVGDGKIWKPLLPGLPASSVPFNTLNLRRTLPSSDFSRLHGYLEARLTDCRCLNFLYILEVSKVQCSRPSPSACYVPGTQVN